MTANDAREFWPAADVTLTEAEREALERNLGGGLAGYIHRIRRDHGPLFNGDSYMGCRCGEVGCGKPLLIVHMDDLIHAYEAKVQDFAEETRRSSDLADRLAAAEAEACGICADHARVEALIQRSSLGSAEATAVRESVPNDIGIAIATAARHLARAESAERRLAEVEAARDNAVAAWNESVGRVSAAWQVYERMVFDPAASHFDKAVWMQHLADLRAALANPPAEEES